MKRHNMVSGRDKFIDESTARQRNIVWPDPLVNSRSVDEFLWKGSPNPTPVQRIGAWLFGLVFMAQGVAILILAWHEGASSGGGWALGIVAAAAFAWGAKIFFNGCRTRKLERSQGNERPT